MNDVWWEDSFNNVLKNISFKNDQEGVHSRTRSRSISMTENEYFNKEKSKREKIEKENSSNKKSNNIYKEEEKSKLNDKGKKKEFKVEVKNKKVKVIHFSDDEE